MSGTLTNSTTARTASSLASLNAATSSPEKVAKYLVRNFNESFAMLEIRGEMLIGKKRRLQNESQNSCPFCGEGLSSCNETKFTPEASYDETK